MKHIFYNKFMAIWQVLTILKTFSGLKTALHVNTTQAESLRCARWGERLLREDSCHVSLSSPTALPCAALS